MSLGCSLLNILVPVGAALLPPLNVFHYLILDALADVFF